MVLKPSSSRPLAITGATVRRNLFSQHSLRRPAASISTSTSVTTLLESPKDDGSEIVVKDQNGNYQVQIPLLPPLEDDQAQDDDTTEKEKIEARLLEIYKDRSIQAGEQTEILSAVHSSLRRKVTSLDHDSWMFEANCWDFAAEPAPHAYVNRRPQ